MNAGCKFKDGSLSGLLLTVSENTGQTADTAQEADFRSGRQNSAGFYGNCESGKKPAQIGMPDRTKRNRSLHEAAASASDVWSMEIYAGECRSDPHFEMKRRCRENSWRSFPASSFAFGLAACTVRGSEHKNRKTGPDRFRRAEGPTGILRSSGSPAFSLYRQSTVTPFLRLPKPQTARYTVSDTQAGKAP